MGDVSLRAAQMEDAEAIARVHVASWRTTYRGIVADSLLDSLSVEGRTETWRSAMQRDEPLRSLLVAEAEGGIVGFVASGPEQSGEDAEHPGEIYAIYLLEEWQGRGVGRRLFDEARGTLAAAGAEGMLLWVLADNPSRGFYEAMGGRLLRQQDIDIGDQTLIEVAYGWPRK